jgi:hypothetical protein
MDRQKDRETEIQNDRMTEKQRDKKTERQKYRKTSNKNCLKGKRVRNKNGLKTFRKTLSCRALRFPPIQNEMSFLQTFLGVYFSFNLSKVLLV